MRDKGLGVSDDIEGNVPLRLSWSLVEEGGRESPPPGLSAPRMPQFVDDGYDDRDNLGESANPGRNVHEIPPFQARTGPAGGTAGLVPATPSVLGFPTVSSHKPTYCNTIRRDTSARWLGSLQRF